MPSREGLYPDRDAARGRMKQLILSKGPRRTPVTPRQAAVQDMNRALREPGASYRTLSQGLKEGGMLPPGIGEAIGIRPGEKPSAARLKRLMNHARGKAKADNFRGRRGKPRAGAPRGPGGKFMSRGGSRSRSGGGFYESGPRQPRRGASAGAAYYAGAGGRIVRTDSAADAQERLDRTTLMPYQEQGGTEMVVRARGNRSIPATYGGSSGPYAVAGRVPQEPEVIVGGRGRPRTRKTGKRIVVGG